MKPVLELNRVTKMYGSAVGVKNISLKVPSGEIFGFLGPNGAGKTTTISMITDSIRPNSGNIKVFGLDSVKNNVEIHRRIGFLAGDFSLDKNLTGWQQLEYLGNLRGSFNKKKVRELAKRFNCNLNRKIRTLSRGNKQKVGLISALMHEPELLIFDEPTTGLDPIIQQEFDKIIYEHQQSGKTAFISSHLLSEVQQHCTKVAFIREGNLIAEKSMREISESSPKRVRIISSDPKLKQKLKSIKGITFIPTSPKVLQFTFEGNIDKLVKTLSMYKISDLSIEETDLESVFMKYYSGEKNA